MVATATVRAIVGTWSTPVLVLVVALITTVLGRALLQEEAATVAPAVAAAGNHLAMLESVYNEVNDEGDTHDRNAVKAQHQLWPNRTIFYAVASEYTPEQAANVREALGVFNARTCLQFVEYEPSRDGARKHIRYKASKDMCGTRVGYQRTGAKSPHDVVLNPYCLSRRGIVQHETMHALGLYHEHSRPDRNDYVAIDYANIASKYWSQFASYPESKVTTYQLPYDYESVMHYPENAFARDTTKPTMRARDGDRLVERTMGQVEGPSEGDLDKLRLMYKCGDQH